MLCQMMKVREGLISLEDGESIMRPANDNSNVTASLRGEKYAITSLGGWTMDITIFRSAIVLSPEVDGARRGVLVTLTDLVCASCIIPGAMGSNAMRPIRTEPICACAHARPLMDVSAGQYPRVHLSSRSRGPPCIRNPRDTLQFITRARPWSIRTLYPRMNVIIYNCKTARAARTA